MHSCQKQLIVKLTSSLEYDEHILYTIYISLYIPPLLGRLRTADERWRAARSSQRGLPRHRISQPREGLSALARRHSVRFEMSPHMNMLPKVAIELSKRLLFILMSCYFNAL